MADPARTRLPIVSRSSPDDVLLSSTSHEVVFAIVGYAGAGPGWVAAQLSGQLQTHGFTPIRIKLSTLIQTAAKHRSRPGASSAGEGLQRMRSLQDAGASLRGGQTGSITAALAIKEIRAKRKEAGEQSNPFAFVIDQLKHPSEVELLRRVYGNSFYLLSVICRKETRRRRLRMKFKVAASDTTGMKEIDDLTDRDEADDAREGQQVRKTLHLGDFFIDNDVDNPPEDADQLADNLSRIMDIITGKRVVRPTRDERGMHAAWNASFRSACLSRQVGAAIMDVDGTIIAVGTNDAPKAGGGLYEEGSSPDKRCTTHGGYCRNDTTKEQLYEQIYDRLSQAKLLTAEVSAQQVRACVEESGVRDLIEFSRAVHAEMDAIISLARTGRGSAKRAVLFCTTYPCHSCARHIIASGIDEVVYIEPYPKSRTEELHDDAMVDTSKAMASGSQDRIKEPHRVRFRLFSGVAPRRFAALFEKRDELKSKGHQVAPPEGARHKDPVLDKSFLELEEKIAGIADEWNVKEV
ncbi:anti-phage dCTP deaminase [Chondromyces apiculatus]|uniref:anti-phage dCTP deaminase n=1 Tax=Chondromyces apiculatus TaxID=51 RepID=UPI0009DD7C57|nr:anti-phage dCTP deaminase [Chondromyces apiculatus]